LDLKVQLDSAENKVNEELMANAVHLEVTAKRALKEHRDNVDLQVSQANVARLDLLDSLDLLDVQANKDSEVHQVPQGKLVPQEHKGNVDAKDQQDHKVKEENEVKLVSLAKLEPRVDKVKEVYLDNLVFLANKVLEESPGVMANLADLEIRVCVVLLAQQA